MRRYTKLLVVLLLCAAMALGAAMPASAAYNYTVTVSSGLHGELAVQGNKVADAQNGGERMPLSFAYGQEWNPNNYPVNVIGEKYYFKGYHIAGHEGVIGAMNITKDIDLVATFGLKGNMVKYIIHYQDRKGKTLRADDEYYGNVGDKPVVAYVYIEGYRPVNTKNVTFTLKEGEVREFTFVYTRDSNSPGGGGGGDDEERSSSSSPSSSEPGGSSSTPSSRPDTPDRPDDTETEIIEREDEENGVSDESSAPAEPTTNPPASEPASEAENEPASEPEDNEPEELIDLDDDATPRAGPGYNDNSMVGRLRQMLTLSRAMIAIGILALLALLLALWFILFGRKKRKKNEQ